MTKYWAFLLLVISAFAIGTAVSVDTPRREQTGSDLLSGRYQLVLHPQFRGDEYLVDTWTGKVWQHTQITDAPGQPLIWKAEDRVDTKADFIRWSKAHSPLYTVPATQKQQ